jgi:hypothetical protein
MHDPMAKWTPAPDFSAARLERPGLTATPLHGLKQTLVSGDLAGIATVGFWGIAPPPRYAIRIARDRALFIGEAPAGFVASEASDAYAVFALEGEGLRALVAEACAADPDAGSPSAAALFAGVPALLYRVAEGEARLHVEASLAAYVWRWLETR